MQPNQPQQAIHPEHSISLPQPVPQPEQPFTTTTPSPDASPQQSMPQMSIGPARGQQHPLPKASGSKAWSWLVIVGVPVLAGAGVLIYFLLPKGSPAAWCEAEYQIEQEARVMVSSSNDDKRAFINKARYNARKLQNAAPSDIRRDADMSAAYKNRALDTLEKALNNRYYVLSPTDSPIPRSEEIAADLRLASYSRKTCTSDGKVKSSN